jgi:hypothetical protein
MAAKSQQDEIIAWRQSHSKMKSSHNRPGLLINSFVISSFISIFISTIAMSKPSAPS